MQFTHYSFVGIRASGRIQSAGHYRPRVYSMDVSLPAVTRMGRIDNAVRNLACVSFADESVYGHFTYDKDSATTQGWVHILQGMTV